MTDDELSELRVEYAWQLRYVAEEQEKRARIRAALLVGKCFACGMPSHPDRACEARDL
jgi:hypothetical protein